MTEHDTTASSLDAPGQPDARASRTTGPVVSGLLVAGITALVSGVAVFVNSYGVHAVRQPAVYTTAKNAVAAFVVCAGTLVLRRRRRASGAASLRTAAALRLRGPWAWAGIAYVGVVGGGVAFVLFFVGLAHSTAEPAAFLHDTLVIWVAAVALPALGERASAWNVAAIGLLVGGQVVVSGGVGHLAAGRGAVLVLGATVLWAIETVVAKRLLATMDPGTLASARMAIGVVVLAGYVVVSGQGAALVGLDARQLAWIVLTGLILAAYVSTWMLALSRARAIDVTSVLVASVVVTSLLSAAAGRGGLAPQAPGLVLVALGTLLVVRAWPRRTVVA